LVMVRIFRIEMALGFHNKRVVPGLSLQTTTQRIAAKTAFLVL
jgi:hypothetical protein